MKEELAKSEPRTIQALFNVDKTKKYLEEILKNRAGQFMTSLISLSNLTPGLAECEPRSLLACGLKAASLNLPLDNNLGFAYAIPFKNNDKKTTEATFMMGFRGFIQLAMRTGLFRSINVIDIREGELKLWDALTEDLKLAIIQDDKARDRTPIIGFAAMFELSNGFRKTIYRSKEKLLAHGKRFSKTFSRGPWQSDTDAMCRKTLIKELLSKWAPLSTEIMEAVKFDQSVIRETPTGEEQPEYIDHRDEPLIEEPTYDLDPALLADLKTVLTTLGVTPADQSMQLATLKGDNESAKTLHETLYKLISNITHSMGILEMSPAEQASLLQDTKADITSLKTIEQTLDNRIIEKGKANNNTPPTPDMAPDGEELFGKQNGTKGKKK